jgi:hypothetical protein
MNPKDPREEKNVPPIDSQEAADDSIIGVAFKWSLAAFGILAVAGLAAFWYLNRPRPAPPAKQRELAAATRREAPKVELPEISFFDVTRDAGIDFVHQNGAQGEKLLPESMGGGCAVFDFNRDGRQDILFINSTSWPGQESSGAQPALPALYRNEGNWKFTNVTREAGLELSIYGQGAAVGDIDNDGWPDLYISAVGANRLFKNNQGVFADITESSGTAGADDVWSTSCGFFDADNDGDLDLFVCNYVKWSPEIDRRLNCTLDGSVRAYCRPDAFEGTFPYLFRNDGGARFTDVSAEAGVQVRNKDTGVPVAKSLGLAPVDADADGWVDLIVANDTVQNFLLHNQRNGTFREVGVDRGIAYDRNGLARGAMGIDTGYFRNDQTLGVVIGNFSNEETALYCTNQGMLFSDDAVAVGLGPPSRIWLKFGMFFFDADNDGRLDVLACNGHLENDISKVQRSQQYRQPPQIYWNTGSKSGSEFAPLPAAKTGQDFAAPLVGRGAAYADFDDDGDLDVLLTATGEAPRLLRNDQKRGHRWLRIELVGNGTSCNRDAIGAWVELGAGNVVQRRQVMPTRSYLSQVELPLTFGLGTADKVDRIVVRWPNGDQQEAAPAGLSRLMRIEQNH